MKEIKKNAKKYKFNFIDVLLLVVIAASVAAVVYFVFFEGRVPDEDATKKVEVDYTLRAECVDPELRKKIVISEAVFDPKTKAKIGEVVGVTAHDSKYPSFDQASGKAVYTKREGKVDLLITVRATAEKNADGVYTVGTGKLAVGSRLDLRTKLLGEECVCVSFSEVEG